MNSEQQKLEKVLQYFLEDIPIDQSTKLRNFTEFDKAFIDAIRELQGRFADRQPAEGYIITDEMKELGFVIRDGSGIAGCPTIPCFGGKMPYQCEPVTMCAIGQTMCDQSPIESMREVKASEEVEAKLKENKRLAKNKKARELYSLKKSGGLKK